MILKTTPSKLILSTLISIGLGSFSQASHLSEEMEKNILNSANNNFSIKKSTNRFQDNIFQSDSEEDEETGKKLEIDPQLKEGAEKASKLLSLFDELSYSVSWEEKGYKKAFSGYVSASKIFNIGQEQYLALGYSEGSVAIYLLDTDSKSQNYMLPLVKNPQKCNLAKHPLILKADQDSLKDSNACKLVSMQYYDSSSILGIGSGGEPITVPVTAFLEMPAIDNTEEDQDSGHLSQTDGILYIGYADTQDEKQEIGINGKFELFYSRSGTNHPSMLYMTAIHKKEDGSIITSLNPKNVPLSESTDQPGMFIKDQKGASQSVTIASLIPVIIQEPDDLFKYAVLVTGSSRPEHDLGYTLDMKMDSVEGIPVPTIGDNTKNFFKRMLLEELNKKDNTYEVKSLVRGDKAYRLYDIASNYDKDRSEIQKASDVMATTMGPNYYYEGTKDGRVLIYGFDPGLVTPQFRPLNYKKGSSRSTAVNMKGSITYLDYNALIDALIIGSNKGELLVLLYENNEDIPIGSKKLNVGSYREEMGDHSSIQSGFTNMDSNFLILKDGSVIKIKRDDDNVFHKKVIDQAALYKNVTLAKLSDDKSKLLLSNVNSNTSSGSFVRVVNVRSNAKTGKITLPKKASDRDIYINKKNPYFAKMQSQKQGYNVSFIYGGKKRYLGPGCSGLAGSSQTTSRILEDHMCSERFVPDGLSFKGYGRKIPFSYKWFSNYGQDIDFNLDQAVYAGNTIEYHFDKQEFNLITSDQLCNLNLTSDKRSRISTINQLYFEKSMCSPMDKFELKKGSDAIVQPKFHIQVIEKKES